MRKMASIPRSVKKGEEKKRRITKKSQTFFKSFPEGPSIAPRLREKNKANKFFQLEKFICFRKARKFSDRETKFLKWGIAKLFSKKNLLTRYTTTSPISMGAIEMKRLPKTGSFGFKYETLGCRTKTLNSTIFAPEKRQNMACELSCAKAPR